MMLNVFKEEKGRMGRALPIYGLLIHIYDCIGIRYKNFIFQMIFS